jgi:hypothetical protein
MPPMDPRRATASFIVRIVPGGGRGGAGLRLEVIDLHSGEALALRSLEDLWRLLRRLAPGLR